MPPFAFGDEYIEQNYILTSTTRKRSRVLRPDDGGGSRNASLSSTGDGAYSAGRHSIDHMRRAADRDNSVAADRSRNEAQLRIQSRPERMPARRPRSLRAPALRLQFFSCLFIPIYIQLRRANPRLKCSMSRALLMDTDQSPEQVRT